MIMAGENYAQHGRRMQHEADDKAARADVDDWIDEKRELNGKQQALASLAGIEEFMGTFNVVPMPPRGMNRETFLSKLDSSVKTGKIDPDLIVRVPGSDIRVS